jgi:hypothetical protein
VRVGLGSNKKIFAWKNVVLRILRKPLHKVVGVIPVGHHAQVLPVESLPSTSVETVKIRVQHNPIFKF